MCRKIRRRQWLRGPPLYSTSMVGKLADAPFRRNLLFALALSAGILNLIDRQIIAVLKPTIAAELHWNDEDYGTLATWFQTGAAFGFLAGAGLWTGRG